MGDRVYPPQPWIHEADCADAPPGLLIFKARSLNDLYPRARPHTCFDKDTVRHDRDCVAEPGTIDQHPYVPSSIWPDDATGPLCGTCRGTHPESAIVALTRPRPMRA